MKKTLFLVLLLGMLLMSCSDDDPYMTIEKSDYTIEALGGVEAVSFETNVDWEAVSSVSWCRVSPNNGGKSAKGFSITIDANNTYEGRRCSVYITSCCFRKVVTIYQQGRSKADEEEEVSS